MNTLKSLWTRATGTQRLLIGTVIVWVLWDIYIFIKIGNAATESANTWLFSWSMPSIAWLCGLLVGHLFFQWRAPSNQSAPGPKYQWVWQVALLLACKGLRPSCCSFAEGK